MFRRLCGLVGWAPRRVRRPMDLDAVGCLREREGCADVVLAREAQEAEPRVPKRAGLERLMEHSSQERAWVFGAGARSGAVVAGVVGVDDGTGDVGGVGGAAADDGMAGGHQSQNSTEDRAGNDEHLGVEHKREAAGAGKPSLQNAAMRVRHQGC